MKSQIAEVKKQLRFLAEKTCVVVSSGNHDTVDEVAAAPRGPVPKWIVELDSSATLISDGSTAVFREELIVSTLSYISRVEERQLLLDQANRLRKETELPWLVVHHHSPLPGRGNDFERTSAAMLVKTFAPTLWVAGYSFDGS